MKGSRIWRCKYSHAIKHAHVPSLHLNAFIADTHTTHGTSLVSPSSVAAYSPTPDKWTPACRRFVVCCIRAVPFCMQKHERTTNRSVWRESRDEPIEARGKICSTLGEQRLYLTFGEMNNCELGVFRF